MVLGISGKLLGEKKFKGQLKGISGPFFYTKWSVFLVKYDQLKRFNEDFKDHVYASFR